MFHVPIRAPTASRMKIAPIADETPPIMASRSATEVCPFFIAIRPANTALAKRATCSGPRVASVPKRTIVSVKSPISTMTGAIESANDGSRGVRFASSVGTTSMWSSEPYNGDRIDTAGAIRPPDCGGSGKRPPTPGSLRAHARSATIASAAIRATLQRTYERSIAATPDPAGVGTSCSARRHDPCRARSRRSR